MSCAYVRKVFSLCGCHEKPLYSSVLVDMQPWHYLYPFPRNSVENPVKAALSRVNENALLSTVILERQEWSIFVPIILTCSL